MKRASGGLVAPAQRGAETAILPTFAGSTGAAAGILKRKIGENSKIQIGFNVIPLYFLGADKTLHHQNHKREALQFKPQK